ncbi:tail tape measure protein [Brevundimonas phage vB_BpoS-Leszy]|nr:tail tape measure protein [Brevundimonas phage vB_BpoS-Leszy]
MAEEVFKVRFTQDGAKEIVRSFDDMIRGADDASDAAAKLIKATNDVRRSADPAQRAYDKLAGSMHTLQRAEQAGIISAGERIRVQERLTITSQAQLRPINTLISKIGEETRAWGRSNTERQATLRTISQVESLMRRGIAVTEQERSAIMAANTAYYQKREGLRAAAKAEDDLAAAAVKAARQQETAANKIVRENAQVLSSYEQTYRNSGTSVEAAMAKHAAAVDRATEAHRRGLISTEQLAQVEARLTRQYAEQIDPSQRIARLTRERAQYLTGLANSGRNLAQVERELARLDAQGITVGQARIRQLRQEAQAVDRLQAGYESIGRLQTLMGRVFGGLGIGLATAAFTRGLDDVTTYNNRLRLVASSQENANRLFDENVQIAIRSRSELGAVVEAYSRIARSTKDLGLSQRDVLGITEAVTKSFRISGASIQEASATAIQFGQALSSNRLGGDELRSVMEQGPRLSQAIVDGINLLNKTDPSILPRKLRDEMQATGRISIGQLRAVAKEGLLTSNVVARAVMSQQDAINAEFERVSPTIAESFVVMKTQWLSFLNDFNKGTGVANMIAGAIMIVGRNLQTVIPIAATLAGMMATVFVVKTIQDFVNVIKAVPSWIGFATAATQANTTATGLNTGAVAGQSTAVGTNTGALIAETEALLANSAAQGANAGARGGAAAAGAAAGAGRVVQGGGAAVNAVANGMTAAGVAATAATPKVTMLTRATTGLAAAGRAVLVVFSSILAFAATFVAAFAAAMGVVIGLWSLLRDKTKDADDQLLIYGEGTTQKAIRGQIGFFDVALGLWDTLSGKTDEISASQMLASEQVKEAGIADAQEKTAAQIAAEQEALNASAVNAAQTMSVYATMNEGIAKDFIGLVGDLVRSAGYITEAFGLAAAYIGAVMSNMVNAIGAKIASFYNTAILPIVNQAAKFGIGSGGTAMSTTNTQVDPRRAAAAYAGRAIERVEGSAAATEEMLARAISSRAARSNGAGRAGLDGGGLNTITDPAGGSKNKGGKSEAEKAADAAMRAYRQLRDELNPLLKITEDYATDQNTLNDAMERGIINTAQHADLMGRLTQRYNDAIDPLSKYIRETNEELTILQLSQGERELATAIMERERSERERLRRALTDDERARISEIEGMRIAAERRASMTDGILEAARAREIELGQLGKTPQLIEAENRARGYMDEALKNNVQGAQELYEQAVQQELEFIRLRDAGRRVDEMYLSMTETSRTLAQDTAALNTLFGEGRIGLERYNRELRALALNDLASERGGGAGRERAIINLKNRTEDMASGVETAFNNAFQSIEDGFAGLFAGAEFDASQLFSSIASDAARIFYRAAIDPLVNRMGAAAGISGFGDSAQATAAASAQQTAIEAQKTAIAAQGEQTRASLAALTTPTQITEATTAQTAVEAARTNIAAGAVQARAGLEATATPGLVATATGAQTAVEAAKTTATVTGVATRTGVESTALGTLSGVKAAETAVHATAEGAKTGATVAGAATRTATEAAASTAAKGFSISTALTDIASNAVRAATGAYAAIAGIPIVGPVLAPAAAAAALYGVYALGKSMFSAEQGFGSVPYDGAVTELHKEEMVLPAKYANPLRDGLVNGNGLGGGEQPAPEVNLDQTFVNVLDPQAMVDAMQTPAGSRAVLNVIQSNPEAIRRALSV